MIITYPLSINNIMCHFCADPEATKMCIYLLFYIYLAALLTFDTHLHHFAHPSLLGVDSGGGPESEGSEESRSWVNGIRRRG